MKLHFISGLPRSGSTLLAAILRQNPRFEAGMSTPLAPMLFRVQEAISAKSEGSIFLSDDQKIRILAGMFKSYYGARKPNSVTFDTNRSWCSKMPLLDKLFPDSKVICCVRDVSWIMDSIERKLRANPVELSGIFGYGSGGTVFSRINGLASENGMVGFAINALQEAYYGEHSAKLLLVEYEALARRPREVMEHIYDFLGEQQESFKHDFDNVEFEAEDFDLILGTPGLHRVEGPVKFTPRESILPPALFQRFARDAFWKDQNRNIRGVRVIQFVPEPKAVQDAA